VTQDIELSRQDHIAILTLNRPAALNSLDLDGVKSLLAGIRGVTRDSEVRGLILTGVGRAFSAGWQLDESGVPGLADESLGVRQAHLMAEHFNPIIAALHDLPFPSVAAVNGVCAGMGVSIALAADLVIAAESAAFVLTFAPKLGLIPDLGATWKLPRLIGWARAQAITMLGDRISAAQAVEWGMIWRSVPDAQLQNAASETAERLARTPPGICREVRHAYHAAQTAGLAAQMDYERMRQRELLDSDAFGEGLAAFRAKRNPDFYR
jgi:2-(1,2-epoxy-1,2-dihydrophenyl)acetyl-CoA isomerase